MMLAVCLGLAAIGAPSRAQQPPPEAAAAWPEAETVRMLLRADAAAALAGCRVPGVCQPAMALAERPGLGGSPQDGRAGGAQQDDIRVAAIFGSTRRLSIDVLVNGALLRYRAGLGAPVAGAVQANGYELLGVEGACVQLRRGDLDRRACLDVGRAQP